MYRINPKLGYVKGNIQVISHRANSIKNDATIDELKKVVNYLESLPQMSFSNDGEEEYYEED